LDNDTILKIGLVKLLYFFGDKAVPVTHSLESLGVEIDENLS
jgi:hypothetical protein